MRELKEARDDVLTEVEYHQIRSDILGELALQPRMPAVLLFFLVLWTLGFAALTAWSLLTGGTTFIWVWVVPLLLSIASWYNHARDYASRRRLSLTDRLAILDKLVASELCSHEESATLRGQIEKLFAQGEM